MAGWMSFRTILAAVAKHKNLQPVLSVGDQVDPEQIGPAPSNAIIVKRAPQLELLKRTSVCITHAGLNTVLNSRRFPRNQKLANQRLANSIQVCKRSRPSICCGSPGHISSN